jgi:hypothetical protein
MTPHEALRRILQLSNEDPPPEHSAYKRMLAYISRLEDIGDIADEALAETADAVAVPPDLLRWAEYVAHLNGSDDLVAALRALLEDKP